MESLFCCARCGEELTDAASIEWGIGPICRKLSNAALALTFAANVSKAQTLFASVDVATLPEVVHATVAKVGETLQTEGVKDFRETVKRLAWIVSRAPEVKGTFCGMMAALGYTSYANVMLEISVASKATVTVEGERIFLSSKRPGPEVRAALKTVKGWEFHPAKDGVSARWSFPVTSLQAFWDMFVQFFPLHDVTLVDLLTAAAPALEAIEARKAQALALQASKVAPVAPAAPAEISLDDFLAGAAQPVVVPSKAITTRVVVSGLLLEVYSPKNWDFVSELKSALPVKDRWWDSGAFCWKVARKHQGTLTALISKHYGTAPQVQN